MKCESPKFQAEQLEERVLLAGNVALGIVLNAGGPSLDISLTGDADDNSLAVTTTGTGAGTQITVSLEDGGTFVPGVIAAPAPVLAAIAATVDAFSPSSITFNATFANALAGGAAIPLNVDIDLGAGNDTVAVTDTTFGGDVSVDTGTGNDTGVLVGNQFNGDVMVDMDGGNDLLHATFNVFGDNAGPFENLTFDMGAGNDLLEYGGNVFLNTGVVLVDGGDGHDRQDWIHGTPDDQYVNTSPLLPGWEVFDHADDSPTGV
ncbi:hypothetical protein Mal4_25800 [Maioricimonas rarisocia]|uniref:Uncharacterized protein n=1 Tax=Maioricimonas rarisocia TaxID=2528026 RepID=A0A517Z6Z6_9PLAN|nr:hypothetical protein [Maioricimonas rarisocia]QDU38255.1 hypothetical protein Mal4_25800 [Maioricimonas rarisocia]